MNKNELITIKYTYVDKNHPSPFLKDCIVPATQQITAGEAIESLSFIIQHPNDYAIRFNGVFITSLTVTDFVLIANGENGAGYRIQSVERLTEFLHELVVTKLLKNPDSDLMAMYPISLEMWL